MPSWPLNPLKIFLSWKMMMSIIQTPWNLSLQNTMILPTFSLRCLHSNYPLPPIRPHHWPWRQHNARTWPNILIIRAQARRVEGIHRWPLGYRHHWSVTIPHRSYGPICEEEGWRTLHGGGLPKTECHHAEGPVPTPVYQWPPWMSQKGLHLHENRFMECCRK